MKKKTVSPKRPVLNRRLRPSWQNWLLRITVFLASAILAVLILVAEFGADIRSQELHVGEPAPRTLFSPFELSYTNEPLTRGLEKEASVAVPLVYRLDPQSRTDFTEDVDRFFQALHEARGTEGGKATFDEHGQPFSVRAATLDFLLQDASLADVRKDIELLFERLPPAGVLPDIDKARLLAEGIEEITITEAEEEGHAAAVASIPSVREALDRASRQLPDSFLRKRPLRQAVLELFGSALQATLIYDREETLSRRRQAAESVAPVRESLQKDELIVQRGMIVTPAQQYAWKQIQKERAERQILKRTGAAALLVVVTYGVLFAYLLFLHRRKLASFRILLLLHTVILLNLLLCKVVGVLPEATPYLMPAALSSLLLAMLVNRQFGVAGAFVMTVLIAPLADFHADVIIAALLSGIAGTFACVKVRKRMEFLRVGFVVGSVIFLTLLAFRLFQDYSMVENFQVSSQGFINGLLITMPCLFLLLTVLESLFGLTTDITLLELSDLNHPLLKRMIIEAPGTYHHSLVVSRLAETACEDIGANALLARVGCYFHDIGKLARSDFFTENQTASGPSKHEKLTPTMSCLVIINHVKDGIELGRKYKLRQSVLDFIPEHQGNGVVYYFYRRALDQAAPGERVNPDDFRYPGPRPQSRETAVALLADSTEAASRSLRDPTPESIGVLVRKIINDKFIDGQLNECDLTLKDLHKIQASFVRNLTAILHSRISYPQKPEPPDNPDLFRGGEFQKYRLQP